MRMAPFHDKLRASRARYTALGVCKQHITSHAEQHLDPAGVSVFAHLEAGQDLWRHLLGPAVDHLNRQRAVQLLPQHLQGLQSHVNTLGKAGQACMCSIIPMLLLEHDPSPSSTFWGWIARGVVQCTSGSALLKGAQCRTVFHQKPV